MSFVTGIFDFLSSGLGKLFSFGGSVVGGIGDFLQSTGIATLLTTVTTLTSSIDSVVNGFATTLSKVIDPITSAIDGVAKLATDIQEKIVSPIITPIVKTVAEIQGLTKTIDRLVDEGIGGIIKIPAAIADALTGVSAAFDRSSRILAEANAKIVAESLVPGLVSGLTPGLQSIAAGLLKFSDPKSANPDPLFTVDFTERRGIAGMKAGLDAARKMFHESDSWQMKFMDGLVVLFESIPLLAGFLINDIDEAKEYGAAANPIKTLSPGDVLNLYQRRIITEETARKELQQSGLSAEKQTALLETTVWLPTVDRVLDWWRRGLVNDAGAKAIMTASGVTGDNVGLLFEESKTLISPAILVDWLARGIMDQKTFDDYMRAQGFTADRILQFIKGAISPVRVSTTISTKGNQLAANAGWFRETYGASPPDDVRAAGHANREDEGEIYSQWQSHWNAMPIGTAITLFFRGEMTRDEVKTVVGQNNYPLGMTDLFIEAQTTLLSPRSVPSLLQAGSITPVKAIDILKDRGYTTEDANLIVDNTIKAIEGKSPASQTDTTKLTVAQLRTAYIDGVLDQDAYRALLGTHGLVGDDLEITVALADYEITKQTKKDISDTLKAEVQLGVLTPDDAIQALYDAGFSQPEVERLAVSLQQTKRASAKLPSLSDMGKMAKKGLIDDDVLLAGIQALGYADPWDTLLAALILGGEAPDGQPA